MATSWIPAIGAQGMQLKQLELWSTLVSRLYALLPDALLPDEWEKLEQYS